MNLSLRTYEGTGDDDAAFVRPARVVVRIVTGFGCAPETTQAVLALARRTLASAGGVLAGGLRDYPNRVGAPGMGRRGLWLATSMKERAPSETRTAASGA